MTKTIQQRIEMHKKAIEELELKQKQKEEREKNKPIKIDTKNLFKFKDLEITKIVDWNKPYNEIVCPKGFRLIKVQELWDLLDSDKNDEFLGDYKGKYSRFWCEQTKVDKIKGYARRLCRNDSGWFNASWSDDLDYSGENCRVCFVKIKGDENE
jgi:hypothetical protein